LLMLIGLIVQATVAYEYCIEPNTE